MGTSARRLYVVKQASGQVYWGSSMARSFVLTVGFFCLPYKWEVHCWVSLSSRLRSQEGPAIQWGAYCRTNWRCTAVLSLRRVGVGVSETLLIRSVLLHEPLGVHPRGSPKIRIIFPPPTPKSADFTF